MFQLFGFLCQLFGLLFSCFFLRFLNCLDFFVIFDCLVFSLQTRGQTQWGPEGGPEPRKSGGPKGGGPEGWGARNFALFFPSPATKFVLFFPLLVVLSWNFGGVQSAGTLKCARLEFSGCRVRAPAPVWWGVSHDSLRAQTCKKH